MSSRSTSSSRPEMVAKDLPADWLDAQPARKMRLGVRSVSFLLLSVIPTAFFAAYLYVFAADQYVSEFRFTIQHSQPVISDTRSALGGLLSDGFAALAIPESESAVGYIDSRQIIDDLPHSIDLKQIYATDRADWWWRLEGDAPAEDVLRYWNRMVSAVFDLTSGIVTVDVRAFSPDDAVRVAREVQAQTERMVNAVSDRSHKDAEVYARQLVDEAEARLRKAELALRDFRNSNTVLTPELAASISAKLESQLRDQIAETQAQIELFRLQGVGDAAPRVVVLRNRLNTLRGQLDQQIAQITRANPEAQAGGRPLASAISDYDSLETELKISTAFYQGAIEALAMARAKVEQQGVYLGTFIQPARPESSTFPRRARWLAIFFVASVFTWALALLFGSSIRDHME